MMRPRNTAMDPAFGTAVALDVDEETLVIFDRDEPDAWIQSTCTVPLEDAARGSDGDGQPSDPR